MRRSGFTLIELLVVVVIIAILVSISFAVLGDSLQRAKIKATQATIEQVDVAVEQISNSVYSRNIRGLAQQFKARYDAAGNVSPNATIQIESAEYVLRCDMIRAALPQRLEDLWGLDGTPGSFDDSSLWLAWKAQCNSTDAAPRPAGYRRDLENSELLYLAISSPRIIHPTATTTAVEFAPQHSIDANHLADDDDDGLPEIIDDWGQPIRFYTWGTRYIRPGGLPNDIDSTLFYNIVAVTHPAIPALPPGATTLAHDQYNHPLNQDPLDFTGSFSATYFTNGTLASNYGVMTPSGTVICPAFNESSFFTLDTYQQHLIFSAGPDEELGLVEPNGFDPLTQSNRQTQDNPTAPERNAEPLAFRDTSKYDAISDNITNGFTQ